MGARWYTALLAAVAACGCGRIGYDAQRRAPDAAMIDAPEIDASDDCPAGMAALPNSSVCIEIAERGNVPWTTAKADCENLGRRLCADAEWLEGCSNVVGIADMTDGEFEWVAEEVGGVAQKRGPSTCDGMSSHIVSDPYEYRCCLTRP